MIQSTSKSAKRIATSKTNAKTILVNFSQLLSFVLSHGEAPLQYWRTL